MILSQLYIKLILNIIDSFYIKKHLPSNNDKCFNQLWPQEDSNPQPSEPKSDILSNWTTRPKYLSRHKSTIHIQTNKI